MHIAGKNIEYLAHDEFLDKMTRYHTGNGFHKPSVTEHATMSHSICLTEQAQIAEIVDTQQKQ